MKKFLLITYYWPPCGGVPVQRWLKLTKYFLRFGWLPTVVTTENGDYPCTDESLLETISPDITVFRTKTPTHTKWLKFFLGKKEKFPYGQLQTTKKDSLFKKIIFFIRTQFIAPDARIIWNKYAFREAERLLLTGKYEIIITNGPPQSTHLVGLKLKKKYGIKWIADFRDPWAKFFNGEKDTRNFVIKYYDNYLEKKVLSSADISVVVSLKYAQCLNPGNKIIIPNAFDPDVYQDGEYKRTGFFRIKYIGALTAGRLNEGLNILKWINEYAQINNFNNIEVSFIGSFNSPPTDFCDNSQHLILRNIAYVEHQKAIEESIDSEALILIINQINNNEGIMPHKLFEYIGSRTFILGLAPAGNDSDILLKEIKAGNLFDYEDKEGFLNKFNELYLKWKNGESIKNHNDIELYSVSAICSKYSEIMSAFCTSE
jgi:hypothetical protein